MRKKRSYDEKRERLFLLTTGNIVCVMVCRAQKILLCDCANFDTVAALLHISRHPVCLQNISETFKSSFWSVLENRRRIKTVLYSMHHTTVKQS